MIRYIHQNPIKAGLCRRVSDYVYSSYKEYFGSGNLVDTDYILGLCPENEFVELNNSISNASCLDISEKVIARVTDEQAKILIRKISKCENVAAFQNLELAKRDKALKKLREKGLSIRQLSRLTGISISVIRKAE